MRNLKKVLAMALVLALAFTFMAGATFKDQTSIKTDSAVNLVAALNIIKGYPDGNFYPEKVVTRAEMAKMIYVLKNGGKDDGAAYYANAVNAFKDTSSHWAKGYINYCYSLGIVAGKGNGIFDPDGSVTGLEAAKMALIVEGYNAQRDGLVGAQWAIKTAALGSEAGLFADVDQSYATGAQRQFAAQIIYNLIFADTMAMDSSTGIMGPVYKGNNVVTVGEKYLGLQYDTGILTTVYDFDLKKDGTNDPVGKGKIAVGGTTYNYADTDSAIALLGEEVTVAYRENNDGSLTIYNVYATSTNKVYEVTKDDITVDGTKVEFDGYDSTDNDSMWVVNNYSDQADYTNVLAGTLGFDKNCNENVKFVDNDDDGIFEFAFVDSYTFGKVTSKSSTQIKIDGLAATDLDNVKGDAAKGDYVLYNKCFTGGNMEVVNVKAAPSISGTVSGKSSDKIRVDGKYIDLSKITNANTALTKTAAGVSTGTAYTIYTDGVYWVAVDTAEAATVPSNYCVVTAAAKASDTADGKVKILNENGDATLYTVSKAYTAAGDTIDLTTLEGAGVAIDQIFRYEVLTSGKIVLYKDLDVNGVTAATGIQTYNTTSDKLVVGGATNYLTNSSSIYFVNRNGTWAAAKGAIDFSVAPAYLVAPVATPYVYAETNGIKYAVVGVINLSNAPTVSGSVSDSAYGYITDSFYGKTADDEYTVSYTLWTSTGSVVKTKTYETDAAAAAAMLDSGKFVTYKLASDGTIDSIAEVGALGGIYAYDGDNITIITDENTDGIADYDGSLADPDDPELSKTYTITDDTVIVYVDAANTAGSSLNEIGTYDEITENDNCVFAANGSDEITVLFYDVNDNINNN